MAASAHIAFHYRKAANCARAAPSRAHFHNSPDPCSKAAPRLPSLPAPPAASFALRCPAFPGIRLVRRPGPLPDRPTRAPCPVLTRVTRNDSPHPFPEPPPRPPHPGGPPRPRVGRLLRPDPDPDRHRRPGRSAGRLGPPQQAHRLPGGHRDTVQPHRLQRGRQAPGGPRPGRPVRQHDHRLPHTGRDRPDRRRAGRQRGDRGHHRGPGRDGRRQRDLRRHAGQGARGLGLGDPGADGRGRRERPARPGRRPQSGPPPGRDRPRRPDRDRDDRGRHCPGWPRRPT